MTDIELVCPKCRNKAGYFRNDLNPSEDITCSRCGFAEVPTGFELAKEPEKKTRLLLKIAVIVLAGIVFVSIGLSLIIMAVWIAPFLVAALIFYKFYQRQTKSKTKHL
ncbi:MAG TPA: hypothetical protein VIB07_02425 [Nitrososphaera sp.]|jgi:hypothetical protein